MRQRFGLEEFPSNAFGLTAPRSDRGEKVGLGSRQGGAVRFYIQRNLAAVLCEPAAGAPPTPAALDFGLLG